MRKNPGKVITRYKFPQLFTEAYVVKTASMEIAVNSFRCTGIYPFDDNIFPESVFTPSATTDTPPVAVESGGDNAVQPSPSTVAVESGGDNTVQPSPSTVAVESENRFCRLLPMPQLDCIGRTARKKGKKSTQYYIQSVNKQATLN